MARTRAVALPTACCLNGRFRNRVERPLLPYECGKCAPLAESKAPTTSPQSSGSSAVVKRLKYPTSDLRSDISTDGFNERAVEELPPLWSRALEFAV